MGVETEDKEESGYQKDLGFFFFSNIKMHMSALLNQKFRCFLQGGDVDMDIFHYFSGRF